MPSERFINETFRIIQYQIPSKDYYIICDNKFTQCKTDCQTEKNKCKDDLKIIVSK